MVDEEARTRRIMWSQPTWCRSRRMRSRPVAKRPTGNAFGTGPRPRR